MGNTAFSVTGEIKSLGANVADYGSQLETLLKSFGQTVNELREGGMAGEHALKLADSYDSIAPSLQKYALTMQSVGQGVTETAENTENTAAETASGLNVI